MTLAAKSIRQDQQRHKTLYDRKATTRDFKLGDWVLVRFPQEETGKLRKLSRPWHGPYRVVSKREPDVTVVKVYAPQDGQIQVHQGRVSHCPPHFPTGFFCIGIEGRAANDPPNGLTDCYRILPLPQMVRTVLVRRWRAT